MPSAKCNSTMERVTGLVSSLLDITLFWDMPFHESQDVQCTYHGLTFVLLCVPVLFTDNARCWFVIAQMTFCWLCYVLLNFLKQPSLHCFSFETLCNKQSIATNQAYWPPHFFSVHLIIGAQVWCPSGFSTALSLAIGFMQGSFLHVCNGQSIPIQMKLNHHLTFQYVIDYPLQNTFTVSTSKKL